MRRILPTGTAVFLAAILLLLHVQKLIPLGIPLGSQMFAFREEIYGILACQ